MAVNVNRQKLLVGGLAAGVVLNIIDFLTNGVLLSARMTADANAFKPGLGDQMSAMTGGQIAVYVFFDFIVGFLLVWTYAAIRPRFGPGPRTAAYVGFLLVWTYAAIRPRFGPGPRTAAYVGLLFFVFGMILTYGYKSMGVMSAGLWWTYTGIWLVNLLLASVVGAMLYSEDEVRPA